MAPKKAKNSVREHWKNEPDEHDYPAAANYLSLVTDETSTDEFVAALRAAPISKRMAKDLLRASRLPLLPEDNPHVAEDLAKVKKRGLQLSPVLLVRGVLANDIAPVIADGYHRICASYHLDENAEIPCRIADAAVIEANGAGATTSA